MIVLRDILLLVVAVSLVVCAFLLAVINGRLRFLNLDVHGVNDRLDGIHERLAEATTSLAAIEDILQGNLGAIRANRESE
jgi:hypothetical protein